MRTVGLRQFQQHLHAELKNLPATITVRGEAKYIITNVIQQTITNVTTKPINVVTKDKDVVTKKSHLDKSKSIMFD